MTVILFVAANEYSPWGASEELWSLAALRMSVGGEQVIVSVKGWHNEAARISQLERAGCTVLRRWEATPFGYRPRYELPESEKTASTMQRVQPDLVILSQANNYEGLGWMEECLRKHVNYVTITHGATEYSWPTDNIAVRLQTGYLHAKACFFVSNHSLQLTERQIASKLSNAEVVFSPYNVPFDAALSWPNDGMTRLACIARLDPETKGQDILFDVLKDPRWKKRPVKVVLFGEGPYKEVLLALRNSLELENVTFGGYVEDIGAIWERHHALVLPSRIEGRPLVIIEAMLCARPVITTNVGGNSELVEDNVTGFVAKAPTAACFDEAMERAWRIRDYWYDMGLAASRVARDIVPCDPVGIFVARLADLL